jgi:transcription termination/antitermination protein NusA
MEFFMVNPILDAFVEIAREKNIARNELIEMIEAGLVAAVRKKYGPTCEVGVEIDSRDARIDIRVGRKVVEEVADASSQISLADAQAQNPELKLEDIVWQDVPFVDFGRNAIQAAKQVVIQRIREAERDKIRSEYSGKIGELLSGTIQQVERGNYVVFLNRQTEAIMPMKEVNRKDHFKQGDPVRACLIDIRETTKGPQLILSRTNESFLKALFQLEVPEIYQNIIDIKGVVRESGSRSKIAVYSHDDHIDAVGACVGLKGSRVQAVVNELGGERIDIIPYSDEPQEYVRASLNPAKIYRTSIDRENQTVTVVIEDDQLSLAIGKSGQNVRLASKLTGWKINLVQKKDFLAQRDEMLTGVFGARKDEKGETGRFGAIEDLFSTPKPKPQAPEVKPEPEASEPKPSEPKPVEPVQAEPVQVEPEPVPAAASGNQVFNLDQLDQARKDMLDDLPVEDFPLSLIEAITPSMREKLEAAGYGSFYQLVLASVDELCQVKGVGRKTGEKIKEIVDYLVEHYSDEEEGED